MHQHHQSIVSELNTVFAVAVGCNLLFAIAQLFFGFYAHSMSLMADAVHNLGDVVGLVLAWGANWLMSRPARRQYSYGYKRITLFSALANALILVGTSVLIIYESLHKLFHPVPVETPIVIIIASLGMLVNGGTALLFVKKMHNDLNVKAAFYHLAGDALISIGVVIAALMIHWTQFFWLDPLLGLCIVGFILFASWQLLRESISLILDAVPHYIDFQGVQYYLHRIPGVTSIHDLHIWGLSTKEIALTAHLVMPAILLTDADREKINKELKEQFHIDHITLQVEQGSPDHPCLRSEVC